MMSPYRIEDLVFLKDIIEAGKVKSVIEVKLADLLPVLGEFHQSG